jgi:hypothetical protein
MSLFHQVRANWSDAYQQYVTGYKEYLKLRGFGEHLNDGPFFRRAFLECWLEPGFHRFWHVWNPGIAYFAFGLYIRFGGRRSRIRATLLAFFINGWVHNLVVSLLFWRFSFPLPWTFLAFGLFSLAAHGLEIPLRFERWPRIIHLGVNAGLVVFCFDIGFRINRTLISAGLYGG